mgnify:CR=1 FL=1|tara:strand:+ start:939 stop:1193 length:255 start_codon:yes stop_codon:yes gene_type:complete
MKIYKIQNQKVTDVKRLNNSVNGNPRYKFLFEGGGVATTPSDAGWVYSFSQDTFFQKWVDITYHVTKSGKNILDSITLNKQEEK